MEAKSIPNAIKEKRGNELMELLEKIEEEIVKYNVTLSEWQGVLNTLEGRQTQMINRKLFKKYAKPE